MTDRGHVTWRNRIQGLRPYTLPMIGLSLLTSAAAQAGLAWGLAAGGGAVILLEIERRTHRASRGERP